MSKVIETMYVDSTGEKLSFFPDGNQHIRGKLDCAADALRQYIASFQERPMQTTYCGLVYDIITLSVDGVFSMRRVGRSGDVIYLPRHKGTHDEEEVVGKATNV